MHGAVQQSNMPKPPKQVIHVADRQGRVIVFLPTNTVVLFAFWIDLPHGGDLAAPFIIVLLIDADAIDPELTWLSH
jgi:hypothetical protein